MKYTYTVILGGTEYASVIASDHLPQLVGKRDTQFIVIGDSWFNANYVISITTVQNNKGLTNVA